METPGMAGHSCERGTHSAWCSTKCSGSSRHVQQQQRSSSSREAAGKQQQQQQLEAAELEADLAASNATSMGMRGSTSDMSWGWWRSRARWKGSFLQHTAQHSARQVLIQHSTAYVKC